MQAVRERLESHSTDTGSVVGRRVHVAIVSAGRDVVAVLGDWSPEGLLSRLSGYVEEQARVKLWPESARLVRHLLSSGDQQAAVKLYFDESGERWDPEQLHQDVLELD